MPRHSYRRFAPALAGLTVLVAAVAAGRPTAPATDTTATSTNAAAATPAHATTSAVAAATSASPGSADAGRAATATVERPHDPFVFRCVLDDNPRTVVVALHRDMWLAYRTADGTLARAWSGDVQLAGSVYDASHGPQPVTVGPVRLEQAAGTIFSLRRGDTNRTATTRWLGYRIVEGEVVIRRRIDLPGRRHAVIEEMPVAVPTESGVSLERRFSLVGELSSGMSVEIELPAVAAGGSATAAAAAAPTATPRGALRAVERTTRVQLTPGTPVIVTYRDLAPAG
ncbi:MAG: hypothetical protein AB8G96_12290 [Phycisphaerales bacterium]